VGIMVRATLKHRDGNSLNLPEVSGSFKLVTIEVWIQKERSQLTAFGSKAKSASFPVRFALEKSFDSHPCAVAPIPPA
jgi:hypothetical protein